MTEATEAAGGGAATSSAGCDEPPALAQFRREAGEASVVVVLEADRVLQCTVRALQGEDQQLEKEEQEATAAATAPESVSRLLGVEVLFMFPKAVFGSYERRKLFMHWGIGSRPDAWEAFPADFSEHFSSSAATSFKSSNAAETEFPSPSSSPPPVVCFSFRAPRVPAYISFLFFSIDENAPHTGLLWIRRQHPHGNVSINVEQLLQQTLQQRCFLHQVTQARKDLAAAAAAAAAQAKKEDVSLAELPPLVTPDTCMHWSVPVGDLRIQVLAFTYVDAVAAAVEIFTNFSAALTLYWGLSDGPEAAWHSPPADALLGQPGVPSADGTVAAALLLDPAAGGDAAGVVAEDKALAAQDKALAAKELQRRRKEMLQLQRMTRQFGGFVTYMPPEGKACQTQFEFLSTLTGSLQRVSLCLAGHSVTRRGLAFLLREVKADRWLKNEGHYNFFLQLPTHQYWRVLAAEKERRQQQLQEQQRELARQRAQQYTRALELFHQQKKQREEKGSLSYYAVTLSDDVGFMDVYAYPDSETNTSAVYVHFTVCARVPLVLHWGVLDIMGAAQTEHKHMRQRHNDQQQRLHGREERWEMWMKEGVKQHDLEKRREEELQQLMARRGAPAQWVIPPEEMRPPGTVVVDPLRAVQTRFCTPGGGKEPHRQQLKDQVLQELVITVPARRCPRASEEDPGIDTRYDGIACCLKEVEGARWFRSADGRDIQVRLLQYGSSSYKGLLNADMVSRIVQAEVEWQHMTLMHRYQLMRGFLEDFQRQHQEMLQAYHQQQDAGQQQQQGGNFAKRVALEKELAVDWPQRHFEPPQLLLPLGFADASDLQRQTASASTYSAYIEDYKELASDVYSREEDFWQWIFVWGRYAFLGLLDWQRNYNTKPKDLAWASEQLTCCTARAWRAYPPYRSLIRSCLGSMGRGGAQGQAIRDRILEIMHKHRIPEKAGQFYEQWHQKLHNNTTPDDVGICEAVIAYLKGHGDLQAYWGVLREHGISRERLGSYERKITCEPYMVQTNLGELIHDFEKYLVILKDVHDALDIQQAFGYARRYLPDDAARVLDEAIRRLGGLPAAQRERQQQLLLQQQRGTAALQAQGQQQDSSSLVQQSDAVAAEAAFSCFQLLSEGRQKILFWLYGNNGALLDGDSNSCDAGTGGLVNMTRELLFLDLSLEQQQSVLLQGCCQGLGVRQLVQGIRELLLTLSANAPTCMELRSMYSDFVHLGDSLAQIMSGNIDTSTAEAVADAREAALLLKALADRVGRYIGTVSDAAQQQLGSKAVFLGQQVGTDKRVRDVFVDEVLRGSSLFPLSLLLKRLEPLLRAAAQLPPWQLVSVVPKTQGELVSISNLTNYQEHVFDTPTVLLCGAVSGEEEIPIGVQAVLVRSAEVSPDILSHVAVRARNAKTLLAVCFDAAVAQRLEQLKGEWVSVETARDGSNITVEKAVRPPSQLTRRASKLFNRQRSQQLLEDASLQLQRSLSRSASGAMQNPYSSSSGASSNSSPQGTTTSGSSTSDAAETPAGAAASISSGEERGEGKKLHRGEKREDSNRGPGDGEKDGEKTAARNAAATQPSGGATDVVNLARQSHDWCISAAAFSREVVGGKSFNLKFLSEALRESRCGVITPRSIALPYGCMQKALADPSNRQRLQRLQHLLQRLSPVSTTGVEAETVFAEARKLVEHLHVPAELLAAVAACAAEEDQAASRRSEDESGEGQAKEDVGKRPSLIDLWKGCGDDKCTHAIKEVWASLFALRPWISLAKAGLDFTALTMAVLVQELLPAHCAFVLHSRNPFSDDKDEMYGELAFGLGEVIVGNYGGRSLGWRMRRGGEPVLVAFPSKSSCLFCPPSLVLRSDSNGEDLENFAGAGLFETVTAQRTRAQCMTYWNQRLIKDKEYRHHLLKKIGDLAFEVEEKFGQPQDIEGVVIGFETVAVVQSRPQV